MGQDKQAEKDFFSNFAEGYDVFTEKAYKRLLDIFIREIHPVHDEIIVDIGCGSGAFTEKVFNLCKGNSVVGMDMSQVMIEKAKDRNAEIDYIVGDMEKMPYHDESCDIVILSGVLHHLNGLDAAIKEMYRILRRGGRCFAFDPNGRNPVMWLFRNRKSPFFYPSGITANERLLINDEIKDAFRANGFKVKTVAVSGISYKYVHSGIIKSLLPAYNIIDKIFARTNLAARYGSFLVTFAEKY